MRELGREVSQPRSEVIRSISLQSEVIRAMAREGESAPPPPPLLPPTNRV